jgi:hypothetical protein
VVVVMVVVVVVVVAQGQQEDKEQQQALQEQQQYHHRPLSNPSSAKSEASATAQRARAGRLSPSHARPQGRGPP